MTVRCEARLHPAGFLRTFLRSWSGVAPGRRRLEERGTVDDPLGAAPDHRERRDVLPDPADSGSGACARVVPLAGSDPAASVDAAHLHVPARRLRAHLLQHAGAVLLRAADRGAPRLPGLPAAVLHQWARRRAGLADLRAECAGRGCVGRGVRDHARLRDVLARRADLPLDDRADQGQVADHRTGRHLRCSAGSRGRKPVWLILRIWEVSRRGGCTSSGGTGRRAVAWSSERRPRWTRYPGVCSGRRSSGVPWTSTVCTS